MPRSATEQGNPTGSATSGSALTVRHSEAIDHPVPEYGTVNAATPHINTLIRNCHFKRQLHKSALYIYGVACLAFRNIQKRSDIKVVAKLNPTITQGFRKEEDKFDYNKDADMFVCPAGHMAVRKARQGKKNSRKNQADTYYFDVENAKYAY